MTVRIKKSTSSWSLHRVKKFFPKVETVSDETRKRASVTVRETDTTKAVPGDFSTCALALAACRQLKVDGAIIGLSFSYLIKGTHATRYSTPPTVAREMVSFDRHSDFDIGTYHLAPVCPAARLGAPRGRHIKRGTGGGKLKKSRHIIHKTARVRQQTA